MAMDVVVQRLEVGDVVVIDVRDQGDVEAMVERPIERTETSVRVTFRGQGGEGFVKEWQLDEMVTVVRGP